MKTQDVMLAAAHSLERDEKFGCCFHIATALTGQRNWNWSEVKDSPPVRLLVDLYGGDGRALGSYWNWTLDERIVALCLAAAIAKRP